MGKIDRKSIKVLWVSLVKFPPLCEHLGETIPAHCGWMYSSAKALLRMMPEVRLGVMVYSYGRSYERYEIDGVTYYLIPTGRIDRTSKKQIETCRRAIRDFAPDLMHIHGTEHSLAKAACVANENGTRMVANIQGLAGPYMRYATNGQTSLRLTSIGVHFYSMQNAISSIEPNVRIMSSRILLTSWGVLSGIVTM